jgi:thiol-disulfide isomerase/thioredoxin
MSRYIHSYPARGTNRFLSIQIWCRRALAVALMFGAFAIFPGSSASLLSKLSFLKTVKAGENLMSVIHSEIPAVLARTTNKTKIALADEGPMPDLNGAIGWLNSGPLSPKALRGKVVLVDFWTYTCINSLRPLPYVKNWAAKYKDAGLVVIGVHSPEFSFEKDRVNVETAVRELKVPYPVAIDSDHRI